MSGSNAVVLWVLGGAGTLLLYSAVKNQSPQKTLANGLQITANSAAASPVPAKVQKPGGTMNPVAYTPQAGQWQGTDKYGANLLYSSSGQIIGSVPDNYMKSPGTFIMNA